MGSRASSPNNVLSAGGTGGLVSCASTGSVINPDVMRTAKRPYRSLNSTGFARTAAAGAAVQASHLVLRQHQCPDSEVRFILPHPLKRTSESKGHWQRYDSSVVLDLKFLRRARRKNDRNFKSTTLGHDRPRVHRCTIVRHSQTCEDSMNIPAQSMLAETV